MTMTEVSTGWNWDPRKKLGPFIQTPWDGLVYLMDKHGLAGP